MEISWAFIEFALKYPHHEIEPGYTPAEHLANPDRADRIDRLKL